jgi:hypothetical protein
MRAVEAANDAARAAKRLADRLGLRGVTVTVHIDRVIVNPIDELRAIITDTEERIMATLDALRAAQGETKTLLTAAADVINEINTDLQDLLARLANSTPGSQEVMDATAEATEIRDRMTAAVSALRSAAGLHTPGAPTPVALSITAPTVAPVAAAAGETTATVSFDAPVVTGGTAPVNVVLSHPSGSAFPIGDTTVTATATDSSTPPQQASATFVVTVTGEVVEP